MMTRGMMIALVSALPGCASVSCCFTYSDTGQDATQVWMLGFGRVTIPRAVSEDVVHYRKEIIGVEISGGLDAGVRVGYASLTSTTVSTNNEGVLVEVENDRLEVSTAMENHNASDVETIEGRGEDP